MCRVSRTHPQNTATWWPFARSFGKRNESRPLKPLSHGAPRIVTGGKKRPENGRSRASWGCIQHGGGMYFLLRDTSTSAATKPGVHRSFSNSSSSVPATNLPATAASEIYVPVGPSAHPRSRTNMLLAAQAGPSCPAITPPRR